MKIVAATTSLLFALAFAGCASSSTGGSRDAGRSVDAVARDAPSIPRDTPAVCGDSLCTEGSEDCESCPLDCRECPRCELAPTCTGALAVPTSTTPIEGFDNLEGDEYRTNYVSGVGVGAPPSETTCTDPQLRLRLRQIVIERGWWTTASNLYCIVSAEDGAHSELVITPPRAVQGNANTTEINFRPSEAVFWGQGDLHRSIANLTITYQCFLAANTEDAERILGEISDRAEDVAGAPTGYGWVFGTASILGTVIGSSISSIPDRSVLDVQQTIDDAALLELTNGHTWEIRNREWDGVAGGGANTFDLRLVVESWGCAGVRATLP